MHVYLVKFSLYDEYDEEFPFFRPFLTYENSLDELEELIEAFALQNEATYLIENIEYLGMPIYKD